MFRLDGIRKLHSWTHACLSRMLDHLATIPENDYVKEVSGFGFSTLHAQMIHIFNCEGFWVHTLEGLPYTDRDPAVYAGVSGARDLQREVASRTLAYLSGLSEEQLNRGAELRFSQGETSVRTPAFILHHLCTHAFHHKGQAAAMCRALGYPAPDTDLNQMAE